jgi:hypothetical protein
MFGHSFLWQTAAASTTIMIRFGANVCMKIEGAPGAEARAGMVDASSRTQRCIRSSEKTGGRAGSSTNFVTELPHPARTSFSAVMRPLSGNRPDWSGRWIVRRIILCQKPA